MAGGIIQEIKNGQLVGAQEPSKKKEVSNDLGYDQFLQILCAEMQYQDPLEPTSNTDYIAQLATFSQLESTLSMQKTVEGSSANDLVGKYVIMKTTSSTTGEISYASGTVDYVLHQNGKTFLSIGDKLYNLEDLDTVADSAYMEAVMIAQDFAQAVAMLPSKYQITLGDREAIESMEKALKGLNAYQQSFISPDALKSFMEKLERLQELIKAAEGENAGGDGETGDVEAGEGTEGADGTEEAGGTDGAGDADSSDGKDAAAE